MRLLFIAFELDEDSAVLAWQGRVANALAAHCEQVVAVAEKVGRYEPADNVEVHALPGRPWGIPRKLGSAVLLNPWFYRLCRRRRIDACFIHMAAPWAYRLAPAFRLLDLPTLVWYAHGSVNRALRWVHRCADRIVTSTPEGFRLPSNKCHVIGQGIDTKLFVLTRPAGMQNHTLVYSGRLSSRKRIELLIETLALLRGEHALPITLRLIGGVITSADQAYLAELKADVQRRQLGPYVRFDGHIPMSTMPAVYNDAFLHINVSQTNSMDKTVLESLACGCPVLTSNEAFPGLLNDAGYPQFILADDSPPAIAQRVAELYRTQDQYAPEAMRALIVGHHDLDSYAGKIITQLGAIRRGSATKVARIAE